MSGTQKALYLTARAGQWVVGEAPIPRPGPKDVLVKVVSAALNPIDWKLVDSPFSSIIQSYPFISGTDGAGIVEEAGEDVTTLVKGDKMTEVHEAQKAQQHDGTSSDSLWTHCDMYSVFQGYFANELATFQQYCLVPAAITAKIPDNISFDEAASIPLGLATAVLALYNQDPKSDKTLRFTPPWAEGGTSQFAGKPAFIIGGSSSVGQYAIQIAKLANFSPIITTASPHNTTLLASLGATHILDRALPTSTILSKLPALASGKPLEFVYDAISLADTQALAYQAACRGGAVVLVLPEVIPEELKKENEGDGDGVRVSGVFGSVHHPDNRRCGEEMYARLTGWLEKGIIKPNRVEVLPNGLAGIPDGLARLEAFKVSGMKLIARPQETP
ncbi:GroES-like protein [Lentinus tigrinus ALCF2SS1-6]|uniref:GroES-like protein n=1 Tax=Lentinus tigrinus ALCF2SS1-6 TaxID=1328759 RepID=A0A5C2S7Q5_9APHY|nr:GroES-like protein [Lentinus tigrinus ALCF2SS1-6]